MQESAEKILLAAEELFARRGYAAVSVRDIAERAQVNKGLVFYYFESKEGLLDRVLERYYAAHAEAFAEIDACGTPRVRLHALLTAYLDFIEDHTVYLQIVQRELAEGSEKLDLIRRGLRLLYDRVEELLGDLTPGEGPLHVRHFFVSFSGIVVSYFNYAPVLEALWGCDPMGAAARRERRVHLHWMVDRIVDGLEAAMEPVR